MTEAEGLQRVHEINLQFLKDFDAIAKKHGIPYYLAAGTLLGAIRHEGFIPWDNDVDVSIMREDFERLAPFLKAELDPEKYELVLPDDFGDKYRDMVPYIYYKKAKIRIDPALDAFYDGKLPRITLDFFLFDRVPDDLRGKLFIYRLEFLYALCNAHRFSIDYSDYPGPVLKTAAFICYHLGKLFPAKMMRRHIWKTCKKFDHDPKVETISITNDIMSSFNYRFPLSWYESGRTARFEDGFYPVPKEAEKALTLHFGDFMTLPPEKDRVPHLSFLGTNGDDRISFGDFTFDA